MGYAINTMILVIFIGKNDEDTEDSFGKAHDFGRIRVVGRWLFKASPRLAMQILQDLGICLKACELS
jgi:hypothetical protein